MVKEQIQKVVSPSTKRLKDIGNRLSLNSIMFRTFLASVFFMISLGIFTTLLRQEGDLVKWFVVIYGALLLVFFAYNIVVYLVTVSRLASLRVANFPLILFLNTFLGFISQLFFFNLTLAIVVRTLVYIKDSGSFICEVKCSLVRYYYNTQVYSQINSLIWWVSLATFIAFVVGNYWVWSKKER